ncbi:putative odorant receptor 83c [Phlebotomus argentipes]|uniref:putative odorant receptor 83c n=1 Tax=Phlebotomus argentipes TaxID=94469 RepID=UPI00289321F1|nr:putative odorant receptor 83c [Phlebotomus argentipes]
MTGFLQLLSKIVFGALEREAFVELMKWIESLYREQESDPQLRFILEKHLIWAMKLWKILNKWLRIVYFVLALLSAVCMRPNSTAGLVVKIPFLGDQSEISYILQIILFSMIGLLLFVVDFAIFFVGFHIMVALNILNDFIKILHEKIVEIPHFLSIVVKRHCDIIQSIDLLNKIIEKISFVQILTSVTLLITLFASMRTERFQVLSYILCLFVMGQTLVFCVFGEFIKHKTERLSTTLYLTNWYELSLRDQKTFLLILRMSQREYGLKAAGMYELNIYLFIQIIKVAFSYCAILYALSE